MSFTRRTFLKQSGAAASTFTALSIAPRPLLAHVSSRSEPVSPIEDPRLKQLVHAGLDSATTAGATYADVRLTHTWARSAGIAQAGDEEEIHVGVRALVNGYWGFASGPLWSIAELNRIGKEAADQAKTNALGKHRVVDLEAVPVVADGHWEMPVKEQPFDIPPLEIVDFLRGLSKLAERMPRVSRTRIGCSFYKQEKAFGATTGSYYTQRNYVTAGEFAVFLQKDKIFAGFEVDTLSPAGLGWELWLDQRWEELLRREIEATLADIALPVKPVDVGRYDVVLNTRGVAEIVGSTIGSATQLDRALGYEANASGTSYLSEPETMTGTFKIGTPLLNVSANRNTAGGVATVKWDDEGVEPAPFSLVRDGVLVDYQTTRESTGWMKPIYIRAGTPVHSHGCAYAASAIYAPLARTANLEMQPGTETLDFDGLVKTLSKGVAFKGFVSSLDFQQLNGFGGGNAFEIKHGKRVARLAGAGILFRAPEFWKSLSALGGASSLQRYGLQTSKGEPAQIAWNSVSAVPAVFKDLTLIDVLRKA